jgi:tetratricopeptide (TPR) repeat protein
LNNKTLLASAMLAVLMGAPVWASDEPDAAKPAPVAVQPEASDDGAIFQEVARLLDAGDQPAAAAAALERLMATQTYRKMSAGDRAVIRAAYVEMLVQSGHAKEAYPELKSLTDAAAGARTDEAGDLWYDRMWAACDLRERADCLESFAVLAQRWPARLSRMNDEFVFSLFDLSSRDEAVKAMRFDALLALYDARWTPQDPFISLDGLRLDLGVALADRGQTDKAKAVAAEITDPRTVAVMRYTRRYGVLLTPELARRDLSRVVEAQVQDLRNKVAQTPDRLSGRGLLAQALRRQGRLPEALAVADDAVGKATAPQPPFKDPDSLTWIYNIRADILLSLGRGDEAVEALKAGAARSEHGASNVSQQLNLAQFYATLGRPREALAAADVVDDTHVSGYGRMDREGIKVEAYFQLRDEAGLKASLDYMKTHAGDAPGWLVGVLVDTGQEDEAAERLIKLLKDPFRQAEALTMLQGAVVPETAPEYFKLRKRRWDAVRQRADVKAAAEAVGRIEALPFTDDL